MGPRCALAPTPPHPTLSPPCAVSPIGIRTQLPVVLSHRITQLTPDFFWLGAGEVDLKVWAGAGGGGGGVNTGAHRHEQAQPSGRCCRSFLRQWRWAGSPTACHLCCRWA